MTGPSPSGIRTGPGGIRTGHCAGSAQRRAPDRTPDRGAAGT